MRQGRTLKTIKIKEPVVCMCCGKVLKSLHDKSYGMIDGGIVGHISAPYGSVLDGNVYQITICDTCIEQKEKEDKVILIGDYVFGEGLNHRGETVRIEYET